jgi:hypothetical protein
VRFFVLLPPIFCKRIDSRIKKRRHRHHDFYAEQWKPTHLSRVSLRLGQRIDLKDSSLEKANFNGRNHPQSDRWVEVGGRTWRFKGKRTSEMSEKTNTVTVSRRSTRLFVEEQQLMEAGIAGQLGYESKYPPCDEKERERSKREVVTSSRSIQVLRMPVVDLGKVLCPIFPTTSEGIAKQGTFSWCSCAWNESCHGRFLMNPSLPSSAWETLLIVIQS